MLHFAPAPVQGRPGAIEWGQIPWIVKEEATMKTIPALKERYQPYFDIGAAVTPAVLIQRGELVRTQFSSLTAENQMKPEPIHPQPEQWRFADADARGI